MKNDKSSTSLKADLFLMLFIFVAAALGGLLMFISRVNLLINTAYLGVTVFLALLTYFFGIIVGLSLNLLFIFAQAMILIGLYLQGNQPTVTLLVWLIAPLLLDIALAGMTQQLRQLQLDNTSLREQIIENGAFYEQTKLRTTVSFLEDAGVFISTGSRFNIPVTVMTLRIRYFSDLKTMLGADRVRELIEIASSTIKSVTRDNDITYILETENPTWAVMFYTDSAGAKIAAARIRSRFAEEIAGSTRLSGVDLDFKIGIHTWGGQESEGPNEFMRAGIKELEYDV